MAQQKQQPKLQLVPDQGTKNYTSQHSSCPDTSPLLPASTAAPVPNQPGPLFFPSSTSSGTDPELPISCQLCPHCRRPGLHSLRWLMLPGPHSRLGSLFISVLLQQPQVQQQRDYIANLEQPAKRPGAEQALLTALRWLRAGTEPTESTPRVAVSTSKPKTLVIGHGALHRNRKPHRCGCIPGALTSNGCEQLDNRLLSCASRPSDASQT